VIPPPPRMHACVWLCARGSVSDLLLILSAKSASEMLPGSLAPAESCTGWELLYPLSKSLVLPYFVQGFENYLWGFLLHAPKTWKGSKLDEGAWHLHEVERLHWDSNPWMEKLFHQKLHL
jgi:hypothetical protein